MGNLILPSHLRVIVEAQVEVLLQPHPVSRPVKVAAALAEPGVSFTFVTDNPHRNFAVLGTSLNILTRKNLKVQLDYNAEVGRGNYTAHYVNVGLRLEF